MNQIKLRPLTQISLFIVLLALGSGFLFGQDLGDTNGDNVINVVDALIVAQAYVGLEPSPYYSEVADVDCSGKIDIVDALLITQYYIGIIDVLCSQGTPTNSPVPTFITITPIPDNPFLGAQMYVDPIWSENAMNGGGEAIAQESTAVILDSISDITDGIGLRGHLDGAVTQGADLIMVVFNNLPYKDCSGFFMQPPDYPSPYDSSDYQNEFIDPIVGIMSEPAYSDLRIICIIEPGTLPNLVTNLDVPLCQELAGPGGYVEGIQYALNELNRLENTYCYLSIAHSSWLGWRDNFHQAVDLYAATIKSTDKGINSIAGFISNYGYYTPVEEPFLPDPLLEIGVGTLIQSTFYEWNNYFDELDYVQDFRTAMIAEGFPSTIGMLIDTGRNGWGGPDRPTSVSTATNIDDYVDESRIDRRLHRSCWWHQSSGIGYRPQVNPHPGVDAYVWAYAPGISDGVSPLGYPIDPSDPVKPIDYPCYPNGYLYMEDDDLVGLSAPEKGEWNQSHFKILLQNAYPPLEETE